jgi:hypothetical protein
LAVNAVWFCYRFWNWNFASTKDGDGWFDSISHVQAFQVGLFQV